MCKGERDIRNKRTKRDVVIQRVTSQFTVLVSVMFVQDEKLGRFLRTYIEERRPLFYRILLRPCLSTLDLMLFNPPQFNHSSQTSRYKESKLFSVNNIERTW